VGGGRFDALRREHDSPSPSAGRSTTSAGIRSTSGLIGLAEFLPLPLLALPAGQLADRVSRPADRRVRTAAQHRRRRDAASS